MAWPTQTVATTHLDQDSDIVVLARPALKQMADNVNTIMNAITVNTFTNDQTLYYDSGTQTVKARTLSATKIGWTAQQYITETSIASAARVSWDLDSKQVTAITLDQAVAVANPTNMSAGGTYVMQVTQDGTGGHAMSWGTAYKWADGLAPTITTQANAVDLLVFYSDGATMYGSQQRNFS